MIEKFLAELNTELGKQNVEDKSIVGDYEALYHEYVSLGQSEFDIIRHFGEPKEIAENFAKTHETNLPDMDATITYDMPDFLTKTEEVKEEKHENSAPTTKAGMVLNDIFFVGLGLVIALAGVIALGTVSILLTATSIYQLVAVWKLAETSARVGGFFLALMTIAMCAFFFYVVVWIVKVVAKFMRKYARDHKENWSKCTAQGDKK